MTPIDLSIKGAIEEFEQGAAVNPIQQAIEALSIADKFCGSLTSDVCGDEVHIPIREALTSLRSLQKEVEGVELPPLPAPYTELYKDLTPVLYEAWSQQMHDYARTAVAAALGRGAGQADDTKMWAVHIIGPDDVHAVPNREIADAACVALNWSFKRQKLDDMCRAEVIEWTHGYEAWAAEKDLFRLEAVPSPEATQPDPWPSSDQAALALQDAYLLGQGFTVDGIRVAPESVVVVHPPEATQPAQAEAPSEREAFEQHYSPLTWESECAKLGMPVPMNKVGHYYFRDDEIRWQAWQARAALATQQAVQGEPVAFEFYNPTTGHAIVDYSRQTHVGPLTKEMGYEARPLGYINPPPAAMKPGDPVPLWQALEALDSLEESSRGDAPYNHFAAGLVRSALEQAAAPPAPGQVERDREDTDYLCKLVDAIGKDVLGVLKQYGDAQAAIGLMASRIKDSIRDARSSEGGGK